MAKLTAELLRDRMIEASGVNRDRSKKRRHAAMMAAVYLSVELFVLDAGLNVTDEELANLAEELDGTIEQMVERNANERN